MKMEHWTDEDTGDKYVSCSALQQGDYNGASYCEANILVLQKEIEGAHVIFGNFYSRQLWLPDDDENRQIIEELINYPIHDEEEMSKVEDEWETEAWDDYGLTDLKRNYQRGWEDKYKVKQVPRPALAECIDLGIISSGVAFELYREAMDEDNENPRFEDSGASLPLDEISETFARLYIEHLTREEEAGTVRATVLNGESVDDVTSAAVKEYVNVVSDGMFFSEPEDGEDGTECSVAADWCMDNGYNSFVPYVRHRPAIAQ